MSSVSSVLDTEQQRREGKIREKLSSVGFHILNNKDGLISQDRSALLWCLVGVPYHFHTWNDRFENSVSADVAPSTAAVQTQHMHEVIYLFVSEPLQRKCEAKCM